MRFQPKNQKNEKSRGPVYTHGALSVIPAFCVGPAEPHLVGGFPQLEPVTARNCFQKAAQLGVDFANILGGIERQLAQPSE